jgi:hypothetical protein
MIGWKAPKLQLTTEIGIVAVLVITGIHSASVHTEAVTASLTGRCRQPSVAEESAILLLLFDFKVSLCTVTSGSFQSRHCHNIDLTWTDLNCPVHLNGLHTSSYNLATSTKIPELN